MLNFLIVNLKRNGDLFLNAQCISSLHSLYPKANIELLILDEMHQAASCIPHVNRIHQLERKSILSFRDNALFNWAWGLNTFIKNLEFVLNRKWDYLYNFSYGPTEVFLCSALEYTNYSGPKLLTESKVGFSGKNECYFGEIRTQIENSGLHFFDFQKSTIHNKLDKSPLVKLNSKLLEENEIKASEYIKKLRKKLHLNDIPCKIIGIQLSASTIEKEVHISVIDELLQLILEDKRLFPLLLLAPTESDHKKANYLNSIYKNSLISIDADFSGITSLMDKLDFIITPDTSIKHLADWVQTPVLEISPGPKFFQAQGSIQPRSLILTSKIKLLKDESMHPVAKDIYKATLYGLKLLEKTPLKIHEDWLLYENIGNNPFVFYWPIAGHHNNMNLLKVYTEKMFYLQYSYGKQAKLCFQEHIKLISKSELFDFLNNEKQELIESVKNLLIILKEVRKLKKEEEKDPGTFIQMLQKILNPEKKDTCVIIPLYIFQFEMDQLPTQIFPYQIDKIENVIFELKKNFQLLTHTYELMSQTHIYENLHVHKQ